MNFSSDRDLLAIEPGVFTDVPFASQQRLKVNDGILAGDALTSATADFTAAGIESGSVVIVSGVALEVLSRTDANTLSVSLLRAHLNDPSIPPAAGSSLGVVARTFAPQASIAHDLLLRLLGLDPADPDKPLNEDAVVSLSVMAWLEALGTLEMVYAGALALCGDNQSTRAKARRYQSLFREQLTRAVVLIDADGDGYADTRKSPGLVNLVRI